MSKNKEKLKSILFRKVCDDWLASKLNSIKESSWLIYKFEVDKHIKTKLGNKTLYDLLNMHIAEYVRTTKMKKEVVIILKSILRYAKKKYEVELDLDFKYVKNAYHNEIEIFNDYEKKN